LVKFKLLLLLLSVIIPQGLIIVAEWEWGMENGSRVLIRSAKSARNSLDLPLKETVNQIGITK